MGLKSAGKAAARQTVGRVALARYHHHEGRVSVYSGGLKTTYAQLKKLVDTAAVKHKAGDYDAMRTVLKKCAAIENDLIARFMKYKEHRDDAAKYKKACDKLGVDTKAKASKGAAAVDF